ncbi:MAG: M1 family metallopeptidase [Cytophagaceae bacterium]
MRKYSALLILLLTKLSSNSQSFISEYNKYDVYYYQLNVKIDPSEKAISGITHFYFRLLEETEQFSFHLYENYEIDSIIFYDNKLKYVRDKKVISATLPSIQHKNCKEIIKVYYKGKPNEAKNPPWDGGFVWKSDSLKRPWIGVACQGLGASSWWPCKDVYYDEPDSMRMSFEVPSNLTCISNGTFEGSQILQNNYTRYNWKISYPVNLYNVTLNAGHYISFHEQYFRKKDTLNLNFYVIDYNLRKAKSHFAQTHTILASLESLYGLYPFKKDGYALIETSYLGMEHQSAISYGNKYKNDLGNFDYIILHESAHEWWGNSITAYRPEELWIHESFATYTECLFIEKLYGRAMAQKYLDYQTKYIKNSNPIIMESAEKFWEDTDMYYKGAWMLHTIRSIIDNDLLWYSILKEYSESRKISIVNTADIVKFFSEKSGLDLHPVFYQYLQSAKIPTFTYNIYKSKNNAVIVYKWENVESGFKMPIELTINDKDKLRIFPTTETKSTILKKTRPNKVKVRTDLFYISTNLTTAIKE